MGRPQEFLHHKSACSSLKISHHKSHILLKISSVFLNSNGIENPTRYFSAEILSVFFKANRIFTVVDDVFQFSGIVLLLKLVSGCSFLQLLLST